MFTHFPGRNRQIPGRLPYTRSGANRKQLRIHRSSRGQSFLLRMEQQQSPKCLSFPKSAFGLPCGHFDWDDKKYRRAREPSAPQNRRTFLQEKEKSVRGAEKPIPGAAAGISTCFGRENCLTMIFVTKDVGAAMILSGPIIFQSQSVVHEGPGSVDFRKYCRHHFFEKLCLSDCFSCGSDLQISKKKKTS